MYSLNICVHTLFLLLNLPGPPSSPTPSLSFPPAVVTFGFINLREEGSEDSEVINVTIVQNIATAAPINLTITPTEYSPVFGPIPPFDPASPNIAKRMYAS